MNLPPRRWILQERAGAGLLDHLLRLRQIDDPAAFLEPNFGVHLHDPFLMKGMTVAVERLAAALRHGETVGIFADYDTDGTPGAALLIDGLRQVGAKVCVYIPTRTEGYGLTERGLDALKAQGAQVVVTIDVGITGTVAADHAAAIGLDLIITDHHLIQVDSFPRAAFAVINPKQADCPYPFKELCGGGVAWKLLTALTLYLARHDPARLAGRSAEAISKWALDLAAIATICDMVPLVGENRVIVKYGLTVLAKTRRLGLARLMAVAGIQSDKLSATTVGFQIGPRINAPTRMAVDSYQGDPDLGPQASLALALLLTENSSLAESLAGELNQLNQERQAELERVLAEATERVVAEGLDKHKLIFIAGQDWPVGIVGLVASRLLERFGRPAVVLGLVGAEAVGSARSVDGLHLVEALQAASSSIKKFGGHTKAAGLTIDVKQLESVAQQLVAYADNQLADTDLGPRLRLDADIGEADLTLETVRELERLTPHGLGNPRPTFLLSNYRVIDTRGVGATGRHLKFRIRSAIDHAPIRSAIGFGLGEDTQESVWKDQIVDLAVHLNRSYWNGQDELDIQVVDLRPHLETIGA